MSTRFTVRVLSSLTSVVDHNGRSSTFAYGNGSWPDVITQITDRDPWGHTVQLAYDSSGRLTNMVDAVSIPSSFIYDSTTGWVTNRVTPYGTTVFQFTGTATNFSGEGATQTASSVCRCDLPCDEPRLIECKVAQMIRIATDPRTVDFANSRSIAYSFLGPHSISDAATRPRRMS